MAMAPSRGNGDVPSRLVQTLEHQGAVNVVKYNNGAKYILSGSSDRTIKLWNPASGKGIKEYRGHAHEVLALDIAHDNAKFASCGGDKAVFVWDVASGAVLRRLQGHFGKLHAVAFSNDAGLLASAGFDAKIMLWDMRAAVRDPLQTLKGATSSITTLDIPPDSVEIIAGSADGHVRSYDVRMGKVTEDLVGAPVSGLTPSPSTPRETMLVASLDGKLRLFDRSNGSVLQTFSGHKATTQRSKPAFARGEGSVLAGDEDGRLWTWSVLDGTGQSRAAHSRAITGVLANSNGKEVITASLDGTIKVWGV
ncbi:putative WD repeat-containing protein [Vanrija pseudolonga]|uniref:Purtative WD repeat-containing protein n=1 Tax=Vanrija pseudolonga TaxID=143232 RepID=A0AAF0Y780_9TREE|nr:purtative WD repeat-containing protein [Vanrija pseudolonga]